MHSLLIHYPDIQFSTYFVYQDDSSYNPKLRNTNYDDYTHLCEIQVYECVCLLTFTRRLCLQSEFQHFHVGSSKGDVLLMCFGNKKSPRHLKRQKALQLDMIKELRLEINNSINQKFKTSQFTTVPLVCHQEIQEQVLCRWQNHQHFSQ